MHSTMTHDPLLPQLDRPLGNGVDVADADRDLMHMYKGGSDQWFVTYELGPYAEENPGDDRSCPQVTRVYLSGELRRWELGTFTTRSGSTVYGIKIEYERTHDCHHARGEADEPSDGPSPEGPSLDLVREPRDTRANGHAHPAEHAVARAANGNSNGNADGGSWFVKIIELPHGATDIDVRAALPDRYRHALHRL
jgi:hypothetical protein